MASPEARLAYRPEAATAAPKECPELARSRPSRRGGVRPLRPTISDVYLFCYRESVIHLNTKVPDGALDFGLTKQQLDGA